MAVILAIQRDWSYTGTLKQALCGSTDNELVVVESVDAALDAIDQQVPDLVLVDALTPPGDVADLLAYLRVLPDTDHVQTISVPLIQRASDFTRPPAPPAKPALLGRLRRDPVRPPGQPVGWDPDVFASGVGDYLARMHAVRSEAALRKAADRNWTSDRRRSRRWPACEVSFTAAQLLAGRAELINISVGGALVRTDIRPRPRRAVGQLLETGPTLTLFQPSGSIIHQVGWPVRCHVRTIGEGRIYYEVAIQFNHDLELEPGDLQVAV